LASVQTKRWNCSWKKMTVSVRMGMMRNAYKILVGEPGGKRPLGRPRRKWEHNI
jgi:hypothetical protein